MRRRRQGRHERCCTRRIRQGGRDRIQQPANINQRDHRPVVCPFGLPLRPPELVAQSSAVERADAEATRRSGRRLNDVAAQRACRPVSEPRATPSGQVGQSATRPSTGAARWGWGVAAVPVGVGSGPLGAWSTRRTGPSQKVGDEQYDQRKHTHCCQHVAMPTRTVAAAERTTAWLSGSPRVPAAGRRQCRSGPNDIGVPQKG